MTDYQAYAGTAAPINFNGLVRQYYLRAGGEVGDLQVNLVDKHHAQRAEPRDRDARAAGAAADRPALRRQRQGGRSAARPAGAVAASSPRSTARTTQGRREVAKAVRARVRARRRASSTSTTAASPQRRADAAAGRPPQGGAARRAAGRRSSSTLRAGLAGEAATLPARREPSTRLPATLQLPAERQGDLDALLQLAVRGAGGAAGADSRAGHRERHAARAADLPQGPAAGELRHRRHGRPRRQPAVRHVRDARRRCAASRRRTAARSASTSSASPTTPTATTRSSGTANGRSPTRPSATWAPPTRSGWC